MVRLPPSFAGRLRPIIRNRLSAYLPNHLDYVSRPAGSRKRQTVVGMVVRAVARRSESIPALAVDPVTVRSAYRRQFFTWVPRLLLSARAGARSRSVIIVIICLMEACVCRRIFTSRGDYCSTGHAEVKDSPSVRRLKHTKRCETAKQAFSARRLRGTIPARRMFSDLGAGAFRP